MKIVRPNLRFALPLLAACLFAFMPHARAQSDTSSLTGAVTDSSGALVANAKVMIHNTGNGGDQQTTTSDSGNFTLPNLQPGNYTLRIESPGFQSVTLDRLTIDPSIGRHVDITLKAGEVSSNVTVEAETNTVQTESSAVGQLVTEEQVRNIQLNGRNPLYLSQLEPGVVRGNSMAAFSFGLDNNINVNGARNQESLITFDGAPMVRTRANGTSVGVADVDTTSQVQILTTSYPAEYGRTSGGQVRIVPKSGSSNFHGAIFEYFRNNALNANTWGRNFSGLGRAAFRYNQFGWNVNGPLYIPGHFNSDKRKLFFLLGQEYVRYNHDDTATQKTPTALMRAGNFSELLSPNIFYSSAVQIVDPNTGLPFTGNIIPANRLSPSGVGLLSAYPLPNTSAPGYNWIDSALYKEAQRKDSIIVDFVPTERQRFRFSLLNYNYNDYEPHYGNFNLNPRIFTRPNQVAVFHYTWTINATTVNDAIVSAAADHVNIAIDTALGRYDRTKYGINYPYLYDGSVKVLPNKIPTIQLSNFGTLDGGPYPSRSGGIVYDYGDNLTKVLSTHTLKFGAVWEFSGENNFDQINVSSTIPGSTNNQNGLFAFTDARTGGTSPTSKAAVANAALGLFDTYGEIGQRSYTLFRGNMFEFFGQDQWHASPKLLLEYGVRYAINTPYYAVWGNQSFFNPSYYVPGNAPIVDPNTGFTTGGTALNGVVIPGSGFPSVAKGHVPDAILANGYAANFHNTTRGYHPTLFSDIQPRLGFAYQVMPGTVIRGGAGRYIQRLGISDNVQVGGNAPFQPSSTVTRGSVDNPGGIGTNNTPLSFTSHAYNYPSPNSYGWNLTFEQDFHEVGTFTLSYVGRRGLHLEQLANINQLQPGTIQANPTIKSPDFLRPYRGYSTILESENQGAAIYHSMQANFKRRLSKGFLFGTAYTWSKSLDFGSSNGTNLTNAFDKSILDGPSDFDTRHVLVINYVWDIPYGTHSSNGFVRNSIGNWQFSGTIQGQSGRPLTVSQNNDRAGVGPGSGNQLWARTRTPILPHQFAGGKSAAQWFDPTAYVVAPLGTFAPRGNRGSVYGPGFQSYSAALRKVLFTVPGHEQQQLVFKGEAFNYVNHPNLDNPDTGPTSGTFGRVNAKGNTYASERQLQFSLRLAF